MHLQEFVIFNLSSYSFSLIISGTLLYSLFLFPHPHLARNGGAKTITHAYLYTLKTDLSQIVKNYQVLYQIVERVFSTFLSQIKNIKPIWQTVGDRYILIT
jgi:hypothetical protein